MTLRDFFVLLLPLDEINKLVGHPHQMAPVGLISTSLRHSQKTDNKSL
jgi:hypothetical protein